MDYFDDELGGTIVSFQGKFSFRMDFIVKNPFNIQMPVTLYLPCTESGKITRTKTALVYCHTHSGNRIESLDLIEFAVCEKMAFVCFDFNGNGESTGKFVTLGWFESLDINSILTFVIEKVKIK